MTADQDFAAVADEKNDDVTMNERIRNEINVSNIIAIDYDEFEKLCKKDNLQTFVFQYDNISATVMTTIFDEKNEKIKISFKYQNYADVFDEINANELLKHKSHDHAIKTKKKILSFESIYNLFIIELETLKKYLNDNLKKEFIILFFSSTKTLIMFVKKKNDDLRLCVDYSDLNVIIVKNRYFISLIKQLLNRLMKATILTKLNIRFTYNALRIRIDDE